MRFIDETEIRVRSGKGGNGCSSFRREKYVAFGGPDGGNGGRGGDVIFCATTRKNTLLDLRRTPVWKAEDGFRGRGAQRTGAQGNSLDVEVPVGTRIIDRETGEVLADLTTNGQREIIAPGGKGGLGNLFFKTSTNRAPHKSTEGKPGVELLLRLELMVMADVGLLGFPNAGKSTFISRVSSAKPKVADYPFTTLVPNLGVVDMGIDGSYVVADIPGLISGAAEGAGLGHRFLKHLSRTRLLIHLVSMGPDELESVESRYLALRTELERYDEGLSQRPEIIVLTKADIVDSDFVAEAKTSLQTASGREDIEVISAVAGEGIQALKHRIWRRLAELEEQEACED